MSVLFIFSHLTTINLRIKFVQETLDAIGDLVVPVRTIILIIEGIFYMVSQYPFF